MVQPDMTVFNRIESKIPRQKLRGTMTRAEIILWSKLKDGQINGYKFRRQASIDKYVVDFYCPELKLAIEVDGDVHAIDHHPQNDVNRQVEIESFGVKVIRFTNDDVFTNLEGVLEKIRLTTPRPSLRRRGTAKIARIVALSLTLLQLSQSAHSAFKDPGYGVRPAGMGNAFVAVSDDANAVLFNPAGATQAGSAEVTLSYAKPFAGLDDVDLGLNLFSSLVPISDIGAVGLGWATLDADSLQQNTGTLLLATSLNRWLPDLSPAISFGLNLHYLRHEFETDARTAADSVFARGKSKAAASFDAGLWIKPDPRAMPGLSLGIVGRSLNEPDLGLADTDPVHREWVGGVAYIWKSMTAAFDLSQRDGVAEWRAGAELALFRESVALRAGANSTAANAGLGYAMRLGNLGLGLDYAFSFPFYVEDTSGSHRVALGMKW